MSDSEFVTLFIGGIAVVIVYVGLRLRFNNAILKNKIEMLERENERILQELDAARTSPESARIIEALTTQNNRLELVLERRNVRIESQEQRIEDLELAFDKAAQNLYKKYGFIGFERPESAEVRLANLADQMGTHMGLEGVKNLCFHLDIDYDDLQSGGKRGKIRELLLLLQGRRRLPELGVWLHENRGEVEWVISTDGELRSAGWDNEKATPLKGG